MNGFELIKQGSEAKLYRGLYLGQEVLIKERFSKKYRREELDISLTRERIKAETKAIIRCKTAGIKTPALYLVDIDRRIIVMEYFNYSITAKTYIDTNPNNIKCFALTVGRTLGIMHQNDIIHGDLTTSNMLLINKNCIHDFNEFDNLHLALIDFGLSYKESSAEDKGVDLYVLERALLSTHAAAEDLYETILQGYEEVYKGSEEVISKLEEIRSRGRKKLMVG